MTEQTDRCVGDNDHGDALPESKCGSCGVLWKDHMGIMGTCADNAALKEDLKDSLEAHDEMRLEIANLRKERDEARRMYCDEKANPTGCAHTCREYATAIAFNKMWDCYDHEPPQQAMNNIAKLDEELGL